MIQLLQRVLLIQSLLVKSRQQDGTNSNINLPTDKTFSITKEALGYFLDEYLNNEIEWDWDGIGDNTIVHRDVANPIDGSNDDIVHLKKLIWNLELVVLK